MTLTATTHDTAIQFLKEEKKSIGIFISDHINDREIYGYNSVKFTDHIITIKDHFVDWDEFYFGLDIEIGFDATAIHRRATLEDPEEKELDITEIRPEVNVLWVQKWDEEKEEHIDYRLSQTEKKEIEDYLEKTLILNDC